MATRIQESTPLWKKMLDWVDARFPLTSTMRDHVTEYYAPKNFNFWYYFGSLALLMLVLQIGTGIFLTMHYKPDAERAFGSVEYIMRDVPWGWLIRYLHAVGASFFFAVIYLHIFRGLLYGSFRRPRELVWLVGMLIFGVLMGEAFMGYLLPWGQMSYWGAQVITSLFGAIPWVGERLLEWIRGDYVVSDATLNRFFSMHVILFPLILLGLVGAHLLALHESGSNNPDGIEIKDHLDPNTGHPVDGIPFHPYYTVKDIVGVVVFLMVYLGVVFFWPEGGGKLLEKDNFFPADTMTTPAHIAPLWYFTPFYAILRAIPDKLMGVAGMGGAIVLFFLLPWLDQGRVKSIRYRGPLFKFMLLLFVVSFLSLGYLGLQPVTPTYTLLARIFALVYFSFFLLMPIYTRLDRAMEKPLPQRVRA